MKRKNKINIELAEDKVQAEINKTIEKLGVHTSSLYESLTDIQDLFDKIRNIPSDKKLQCEELKKKRLNWKRQTKKIEKDCQATAVKNSGAGAVGAGAAGVGFGVASTGTAISTLSGVAANNAALAWLGGGARAVGGGGMAAGEVFLASSRKVGWAIVGVSLVTGAVFFWKSSSDKKHLENVFTAISKRNIKSYELAVVELKERIKRIIDENGKLNMAIENIETFGLDYNMMTEAQQYELDTYVNLMLSSTQLLINPIKELSPKFSREDFDGFITWKDRKSEKNVCEANKDFIISMANYLYKINLDDRDKKLLWKFLRKNKKMLKSMDISKKEFDIDLMNAIVEALSYKYAKASEKTV